MTDVSGTQVSAWLHSLGYDARPLVASLRIGQNLYRGAEYEAYGDTRMYLLGDLPACYARNRRTMFRIPHDARDWYVATYCVNTRPQGLAHEPPPFGKFVVLCPWTISEPIDKYDRTPRPRVQCEWATPNLPDIGEAP